ncbi:MULTISPECIES: nitroreductase family deazaflavin-dependent oxidoreductase [Amycolatopsis]|uniref:Deazaflavin-dependent oxidoreductase, nitroreductase family n=2 Tax=Amycolatopsis TaxID=1813 RepID=A0A1I3TDY0_9PSEU|nr:nitroreductase family deazaflavin-dependent oxidoreductase [Amycolatopsis sacchari]SFJ67901.1 deazaflavin-dependent oxidoreductase, nitroreductase family [Amycolatopsis sacchari]
MPKAPAPTSPYWKLQRQMTRFNTWLFRTTGGKAGSTFRKAPVLLLNHVGRKSGQARTSPLIYLDDAPRLVIVASKGGTDAHPAWFHNLMAMESAEVELPGGERRRVRPRVAEGDERAALWERLVAIYRPYAAYATYTQRQIPVVVLEPAG